MKTPILLIAAELLSFSCQLSTEVGSRRGVPANTTPGGGFGGPMAGERTATDPGAPDERRNRLAKLITLEDPAPGEPGTKRLVIYTGQFAVLVANVPDAVTRFLEKIESLDGYLESREDARLVCRVPAEHFQEAVEVLPSYGLLLSEKIQAADVTSGYHDLDLRIATAQKALERLVALLERAEAVEEILEIEKEIHRLTEQIERMKGQLRQVSHQIAFSTLHVDFRTNAPAPRIARHRTQSPFPWIRQVGMASVLDDF